MKRISNLVSVTLVAIGFVTLLQTTATASTQSIDRNLKALSQTVSAQWTPPSSGLPRRLSGGGTR